MKHPSKHNLNYEVIRPSAEGFSNSRRVKTYGTNFKKLQDFSLKYVKDFDKVIQRAGTIIKLATVQMAVRLSPHVHRVRGKINPRPVVSRLPSVGVVFIKKLYQALRNKLKQPFTVLDALIIIILLFVIWAVFLRDTPAIAEDNQVRIPGVGLVAFLEPVEPLKAPESPPAPIEPAVPPPAPEPAPAPAPVAYSGSCADWLAAAGVDDVSSAMALINRESGCNPQAQNPSGACGVAQELPCGKSGCAWGDGACQVKWMNSYCLSVYGSWAAALAHSYSHNWY